MKTTTLANKIIISSFLSLFSLYSCSSEQISSKNVIEKNNISSNKDFTVRGIAEFDDSKNNFKIKSDTNITTRATVSLIYSSDYANVSLRNATIATGLSDSNGNFSINPDQNFIPENNNVMILEAKKRIGGAGNSSISLRTNIRWNGSKWESISSPNISINKKTTALSIISSLDPNTMSSSESINKLVYLNNVGHVIFNSKLTISRFNAVYKEVENFIFYLRDPVEEILRISSKTGSVNSYSLDNKIRTNMHTLQSMLETYGVDWSEWNWWSSSLRKYPDTVEKLEQEAKDKKYWKEITNPFLFYQDTPYYFPSIMSFSDYEQAKTTLSYKGNNFNDKSDLKGITLYQPIIDAYNSITKYYIYAVNINGDFIKSDYKDENSVPFVLTNY